jgi:hypothetical protein
MADELNIPRHRWYQRRYHVRLRPDEVSRTWILASGIAKIDALIFNPPSGTVWVFANGFFYDPGVWLDQVVWVLSGGTFNDNGVWMDEVM